MEFPVAPKRVVFSGLGEPLMNPKLGEMIRKLRNSGFNGRIDIITNAVELTPQRSAELIDAGVSRIQISVQGLTDERCKEITGVEIDMGEYVNNIRWFFEHKKCTDVFIKIIDVNLRNDAEKTQFFDMFSGICDSIWIEHLVDMSKQAMEYTDIVDRSLNFNGENYKPRKVCSIMFYLAQITIDGNVYPCPIPGLPTSLSVGNVRHNSLLEIWNGAKRFNMCKTNLSSGYRAIPGCLNEHSQGCDCTDCIADEKEFLDDYADKLLARLEAIK
jgi:radical SAM protein with 4Fe4S-binding SPASM domain